MTRKCIDCKFAEECNPALKEWGYYCSSNTAEKAGRFIDSF